MWWIKNQWSGDFSVLHARELWSSRILTRSTASTRLIDFETNRRCIGGGGRGEAEKSGEESGINENEDGECGGDEELWDRRRQHFWNTQTRWRRPDCTTLLESIRQSSPRMGKATERMQSERWGRLEREERKKNRDREKGWQGDKEIEVEANGISLRKNHTYAGKILNNFNGNTTVKYPSLQGSRKVEIV